MHLMIMICEVKQDARFFTAEACDFRNQHVDVVANTFMTTLLDHRSDFDFHASLISEFKIMGLYCLLFVKETTTLGYSALTLQAKPFIFRIIM